MATRILGLTLSDRLLRYACAVGMAASTLACGGGGRETPTSGRARAEPAGSPAKAATDAKAPAGPPADLAQAVPPESLSQLESVVVMAPVVAKPVQDFVKARPLIG